MTLPKVIASTVVRGARRGESHGGIFIVDLDSGQIEHVLDWDHDNIDFTGRGGERGLRGIAIDGNEIFVAASDELFVLDRSFNIRRSYRNRYLKHCHEISLYKDQLFLTSAGHDSILVFDNRKNVFTWGLYIRPNRNQLQARVFDPMSSDGPPMRTKLHINSVFCNTKAVMSSGMLFDRIFRFREKGLDLFAELPRGSHNVQMHKKGILFNDTSSDYVRYIKGGDSKSFSVPRYRSKNIINIRDVSERVARPHFARGLCPLGNGLIAAGSSPATIAVHDLNSGNTVKSINISMNVCDAIHGLEVWPFTD